VAVIRSQRVAIGAELANRGKNWGQMNSYVPKPFKKAEAAFEKVHLNIPIFLQTASAFGQIRPILSPTVALSISGKAVRRKVNTSLVDSKSRRNTCDKPFSRRFVV
jgi:hypothetical protein